MRIRHVVMWNVTGGNAEQRRANCGRVKSAFESLLGLVPGLIDVEVGINVVSGDDTCDVVLVSTFESPAALGNYADHPEHSRVRRELEGLRTGRRVVDYEI